MFTGIVEEIGQVAETGSDHLKISAKVVLEGTVLGHSIAVNGVCLTVTAFDDKSFTADIMAETMRRSNLGDLKTGDAVNLERAVSMGGHMGGHLVQGHIDTTGSIVRISPDGEALLITVKAPPEIMQYVVEKGFIAVDGISLTVVRCDATSFQVSMVGFTRDHTTLGSQVTGGNVNLETDIIAKYVARMMTGQGGGITPEFLQDHGYPLT